MLIGLIIAIIIGGVFKSPILGLIIILLVIVGFKSLKRLKISMPKKEKKVIEIGSFKKTYATIIIIILAALVYFFRPWFHNFAMVFYTRPAFIIFVLAAMAAILLFIYKKTKLASLFVAVAALSFIAISFNDIIMQRYIVTSYTYNKIDSLPDSTDIRILPKAVAYRYLEDSLQKSRERIGGINIVNLDSSLYWLAPRVPNGKILYLTQKVNGLMTADATKTDRKTKMIDKELAVGEDIGIFDNIYWKIFKQRYFIDLGDVYYIYKNDIIYTIAPIISYKFKFPVMVPYFDGVFLIDEQGNIKKYSPEEVAKMDEFKNNRAYPEELARLYVDSYKYNLGFINKWFLHKDQIEITDVYGQDNRQPFLMPTTKGLKWVIATEPYGESYGVFKIFLVDALTGKIEMLELNEDQTLTGPVKVVSYVRKKFPVIDWSASKIVEPRPFVIKGKLYWMLSITPNDNAGIAYTVFVNSENNEVTAFENDEGVYKFVKEGVAEEKAEAVKTKETAATKDELRQEKIEQIEKLLEELKQLE